MLNLGVVCSRAKRYERMMKFHGLHQPASAARETFKLADPKEPESPTPASPVKRVTEKPSKNNSSPKKRARKSFKGFDGESCNLAMHDDEGLVPVGPGEIKTEKEAPPSIVKEEPQASYHGMTGFQYALAEEAVGTTSGEEGADLLSDFLRPEDFEPQNGSDNDSFGGLGYQFSNMEHGPTGSGGAMEESTFVIG